MQYAHFYVDEWERVATQASLEVMGAAAALFMRCIQRNETALLEDYGYIGRAFGTNSRRARRIIAEMIEIGLIVRKILGGEIYLEFPVFGEAVATALGKTRAAVDAATAKAAARRAKRAAGGSFFASDSGKMADVSRKNGKPSPSTDTCLSTNQTLTPRREDKIRYKSPLPQDDENNGGGCDGGDDDAGTAKQTVTADQITALREEMEAAAAAEAAELEAKRAARAPAAQSLLNRTLQRMGRIPTPRQAGTNPRAMGTNPRAVGANPRMAAILSADAATEPPLSVCTEAAPPLQEAPSIELRSRELGPLFGRLRLEIGDDAYDADFRRALTAAQVVGDDLILTGAKPQLDAVRARHDAILQRVTRCRVRYLPSQE